MTCLSALLAKLELPETSVRPDPKVLAANLAKTDAVATLDQLAHRDSQAKMPV